MKKRRYVGTSQLFNVQANEEFVNGLSIEITEEGVEAVITTPLEPERKRKVSGGELDGRALRKYLLAMEQEHHRARRQAGEFAFFKPRRRKRPAPTPACGQCGGYGGNEDTHGNWVACSLCNP